MSTKDKTDLYKNYLLSSQQVLDAWFTLRILYSNLADAYDKLCHKFFEQPPKKIGHKTVRYCIAKQYKPVMADVFQILNRGFPKGQDFSEPLFSEKSFCEYYTHEKMCIIDGCEYYSLNKQYFEAMNNFQIALDKYKQIIEHRNKLYNEILTLKGRRRQQ